MKQTRAQDNSLQVFYLIEQIKHAGHSAEYGAYAVELPALIRHNGLIQTLAFLAHKGPVNGDKPREHAARQVHGHLLEVLCCKVDDFDLMSTPDYALCTRRALEAAQYFKRFAESVLGVDRENVEQVS